MTERVISFLTHIYSIQCEANDYVMLACKSKDTKWRDYAIKYNSKTIKSKLQEFLNSFPPSKYDLYFSPMSYSSPHRRLSSTIETKFLIQDIDEHTKPESIKPKPTYIWESSPNKYQGMWELDRYIQEERYTRLNKSLASKISDLAECFDYTHVYRIPGTINHKYKNKPKVKMPKYYKEIYKPKHLESLVGISKTEPPSSSKTKESNQSMTMAERQIYARYSIPQKVMDLLALTDISHLDRSDTIWYIENQLHDMGMTPNEIILLVKNSAFNKYHGRNDEDKRLKNELNKIIKGDIIKSTTLETDKLKLTSFNKVMTQGTFEGWLVEGFWGMNSHGIVAGMPKCFKSTLAHDLAISVASGKPFLNRYKVDKPGPVIIVQNENADYLMRDRNEKMMYNKKLIGEVEQIRERKFKVSFVDDLPITYINQQGFLLDDVSHQKQMEDIVKTIKPRLIIFDPLYLMFTGDLNSAKDLNPMLSWLIRLKEVYKTSVMLIHHYNKGNAGASKGGQRMMGSNTLYGWIESAWYLYKEETQIVDAPTVVNMTREFRMSKPYQDVSAHISMGEIGSPQYNVEITNVGQVVRNEEQITEDMLSLLSKKPKGLKRRDICKIMNLSLNKVREILDSQIRINVVQKIDNGYRLSK